jgi:hypothetical protein
LKKPNFFIVGAPKCGTTAMNNYLAQHPEIFMAQKELHFFGADLKMKNKISEAEYLENFKHAGNKKIIGEASVWYLYSKTAAAEIKNFSPDAKILIMLRNPIDVIYSLHSQHLINANEDVEDFERAFELDNERSKGRNFPDSLEFVELPSYRDSALFAQQVKRYNDAFGNENVHIILYEDFKNNLSKTFNQTLSFLALRSVAEIKTQIINPNKKVLSLSLHRLIKYPSNRLKTVVRKIVPFKKLRHKLMVLLLNFNIKTKKRKDLDKRLRNELKDIFSNDIKDLALIINRDLSEW